MTGDLDATPLPFRVDHAFVLGELPLLRRDPFDRMLICQAKTEGLTLLTADHLIGQYDVPKLW